MHKRLWKTAAIAGLISVLMVVFLLVGIVFVSLYKEDPKENIGVWVTLVTVLAGGAAGALGVKLYGERSLPVAILSGSLYVVLLILITLPLKVEFQGVGFVLRGIIPVAAAVIGGSFLGGHSSSRLKNRRKAAKHAGKIYGGKHLR